MTPEKLKEIEAKAQEAFKNGTYNDRMYDWLQENRREGYITGALSRQPELDTLQKENDRLRERQEYLEEVLAEYKCDYESLKMCVSKILTMTDNAEMIELINDTDFHLCANMK